MSYKHYDKIIEFVKFAINAHGSFSEDADALICGADYEGTLTLNGNDIDQIAADVAEFICGEVDE